jgi:hypothetical protein
MGLHDPCEHLKHKLFSKERPRVKLALWPPTTKSRELTRFTCVQVACHMPLKSSQWRLQLCLRPHINKRSIEKVMGPQSRGSHKTKCQVGVLKFPKLGLFATLGPITFSVELLLIWGLKQSCSPRQELSNGMWHATCTLVNQVNSRLLVVGSQIANLTPVLSFDHNFCFRCPNESYKPISDICVPRAFQWHKERLNPMSFDLCNRSLKIRESIGTITPKVGVPLGMWRFIPSHSFALMGAWNVTLELPSWPALLQAFCLGREPKARAATPLNLVTP